MAIKGAAEAEEKARKFLKEKHPNTVRIMINKINAQTTRGSSKVKYTTNA